MMMRRILYLTPGTEPDGAATQLALLCRGLPRDQFNLHLCTLGSDETLGPALRRSGVARTALGWTRLLDPRPLWRLRRLVRAFQPDLIHAFRPVSLRALALAVGRPPCPLVVSRPGGKDLGRLDRWLLGRADRVIVEGNAAADRCLKNGVAASRIALIPPGVELPEQPGEAFAEEGKPGRALLCAGRFEPHKGYREAMWAFDILRYIDEDLRLVLAGDGPYRARLEQFARRSRVAEHVDFAGLRGDLNRLMATATVVWIPSLADGGVSVALEAMAAGRPVVASRLPGLAEVVSEGETGLLVPPGDKVALARQTRRLLGDEALRIRLGEAGRARAARHFAASVLVERTAALYPDAAALCAA
jgi:glycosyltransferase involved in cell wall biosynthesis